MLPSIVLFAITIVVLIASDYLRITGLAWYMSQENFILIVNTLVHANVALIGFTAITISILFSIFTAVRYSKKKYSAIMELENMFPDIITLLFGFITSIILSQVAAFLFPIFWHHAFVALELGWCFTIIAVWKLINALLEAYETMIEAVKK